MRAPTLSADAFAAELVAERRPFVLDTRSREEFEAGHVPGSRNVPVHELGRRQDELPSSKVARILVIGEPGRRSEAAAAWLVLMGYADVALVEGGIAAHRGELEKGPAGPLPPRWQPELRVLP
jgi:rhodanese-related sulfurtransferase